METCICTRFSKNAIAQFASVQTFGCLYAALFILFPLTPLAAADTCVDLSGSFESIIKLSSTSDFDDYLVLKQDGCRTIGVREFRTVENTEYPEEYCDAIIVTDAQTRRASKGEICLESGDRQESGWETSTMLTAQFKGEAMELEWSNVPGNISKFAVTYKLDADKNLVVSKLGLNIPYKRLVDFKPPKPISSIAKAQVSEESSRDSEMSNNAFDEAVKLFQEQRKLIGNDAAAVKVAEWLKLQPGVSNVVLNGRELGYFSKFGDGTAATVINLNNLINPKNIK